MVLWLVVCLRGIFWWLGGLCCRYGKFCGFVGIGCVGLGVCSVDCVV